MFRFVVFINNAIMAVGKMQRSNKSKGSIISDNKSRGVVNALAVGSFVRDLGQYIVWVIMSVFLNEIRDVSYIGVGMIFLVGGLLSIPLSIYGGNLIDRIGRRKVAVTLPWILFAMFGALFFMIYLNLDTIIIVALFIAAGPIQSLQWVTFDSIVSDVSAPQDRVAAFSLLRITANAGIGVGLVLGGLISEFDYSYVFIMPAFASAFEGALYYYKIPETSTNVLLKEKMKKHEKLYIPLHDRLFIAISLMISLSWFISGMFESALTPLYFSSIGGYTNFEITVVFAVNTIVVLTVQTPINRLFKNVSDTTRIVFGLLLFCVGFIIFALTFNYLFVVIAVVILTTGENLGAPASSAIITKLAPEDRRGAYFGLSSSIGSVISPFRPLVATSLLTFNLSRPENTWYTIAASTFAISMLLMVTFRASRERIIRRSVN